MKTTRYISISRFLFTALTLCSFGRLALASDPTAFDLIEEADRYVGEEAKDKVVQIRSDKSLGTLTPTIWYVVFYDPDATFKVTEVKFGAGKKMGVKRPWRVLEMPKADKVFDKAKLTIDSDAAIKTATAEPLLKNLTVKATQLWLDVNFKLDLNVTEPVWKVRIWAAKLKNPNDDADIGDVYISAETGRVLKTHLHIDRVD